MGKRLERREQRKQTVLQCAATLLSEHTAESLKMSELAQQMGCSVGGLYRYYPSKEAIFAALQLEALTQLQHTLESDIQSHLGTSGLLSWEAVETLFDAWTHFELQSPTLANVLNRFAWRNESILSVEEQRQVGAKVMEIVDILKDTLQRLSDHNVLSQGNAEVRAYTLWGMVFGLLQLKRRQASGLPNLPVGAIRTAYLEDLRRSWAS